MPSSAADIYQEHFSFVWRNLRRLGVPASSLEDAAHDVFLVVIRRLSEFEQRSSLRTWIFGILHHVAQGYRRRQSTLALGDDVIAQQASTRANPEQARQTNESLELLNALLTNLDMDQRTVLIMVDLEELSAPEVAEALGVKLNTVYSRLRLARAAFDAALQRHQKRT